MKMIMDFEKVSEYRGYGIYRRPNGVGGYIYISGEHGQVIWDTSSVDRDALEEVLNVHSE